jgi:hypothetical protein
MKKVLSGLFAVLMLAGVLSGCGRDAGDATTAGASSAVDTEAAGEMPTVVNTAEYTLYQNVFFNKTQSEYVGKEAVKEGTFTTLIDAFSNVTRYYVWGYNDRTKCCDWQWELKIDDASDLPENGSLIRVKGVYEENEDALDDFWIIDPEITVKQVFPGRDFDIDMQSMDDTLERVQLANIVRNPETFEGKTVCGYGRILNANKLEDPYYDNSWQIDISGDYEVPAFGTLVLISGTVRGGAVADCTIEPNTQY